MEEKSAVKMLASIAHEGRLKLLRHLIQAGPIGIAAGDLAALASIAPNTASAQLLVLTNANLIRSERRGRQIVYFARYEQMRGLLEFLMLDCCCGQPSICKPVAEAVS